MHSECQAAATVLAVQKCRTAPGARLPAECSAPGLHGLKETHMAIL